MSEPKHPGWIVKCPNKQRDHFAGQALTGILAVDSDLSPGALVELNEKDE